METHYRNERRNNDDLYARPVWSRAVNLRRDPVDRTIWRRVGTPRKLFEGDALLFARFSPFGDGREICLLCGADNSLYYTVITKDDKETATRFGRERTRLGFLSGRPIMAITDTPGVVKLLLEHKPEQYLTYDGELTMTLRGEMPRLPGVCLAASDYNTLYGAVETVKLSGTSQGNSGSQLSEADNRQLASALIEAYDSSCRKGRGMGYSVQPRMARYRLLDATGNTVAVGPTVMLSIPDGFSATGSIVQTSADSLQTLAEGRIELGVYRPAVIAPPSLPSPWNRLVNKLIIEISDEIDPLLRGVNVGHGIHRNEQSGVVTVTSRLPGFSNGTVIDKPRLHRLGVEGLTAPMYVVAEFDNPFGGGLGAPGNINVITADKRNSPAVNLNVAEIMKSGKRSWSAGLRASNLTLLCNPLVKPFGGWSPDCFAASRSGLPDGEWRLAISVRLSTPAGDIWVGQESTGSGNAPTSLLPILTYPSPDAVEMAVSYLAPDGRSYEENFPLTPVAAEGIAFNATSGLERTLFKNLSNAYLPKGGEPPQYLETGVAETYLTADLGRRIDRCRPADGLIHAVAVTPRSGSGWDFSRLKLLFFGESGTFAATLNGKGEFHTFAPVDRRPVMSSRAVCEAGDKNGASILLYAGNDLLSISGQKVNTLKTSVFSSDKVSIGWERVNREAWLSTADNNEKLYRFTEEGELIKASLPGMAGNMRFTADSGRLLVSSENAVYDLSDEVATYSLEVSLTTRVRASCSPTLLRLNIFADQVDGTVTLSGDRGTEIAEQLLRLEIDGAVNAPITLRLAAPRREWLETEISLTATSDLTILPVTFLTDDNL